MILLLDCFDSFTYNLWHSLEAGGAHCSVVRENELNVERISEMPLTGIVISPGPQAPKNHPVIFELLNKMTGRVPILGICLGFQAIGQLFGWELLKAPEPAHGKVSDVHHDGHPMFRGVPTPFPVTRYHSLCLREKADNQLQITARTKNGLPMSMSHKKELVWGHQFHPEAVITKDGQTLVENWLQAIPVNFGIL